MRRILSLLIICCLLAALPAWASEGHTALKPGDSGPLVRQMQQRLIELGLLKGKADGLYGPKTEAALLALQQHLISQKQQLSANGQADPATLALMYDDLAMSSLLDLKPGDKGSRVSRLQAVLYDLRLLSSLPDGDYGSHTQAAVLAFQQQLAAAGYPDITATGLADHATRQVLMGDLSRLPMRVPQTFDDRWPAALTGDDLYAKSALLVELSSGHSLFGKEEAIACFPASTTKIMTLLLALEQLPDDRLVTIPEEAAQVPKDSSLTPVTPGEQMPAIDLFYGLMLRSGNDAANALAVICRGSVEAFVAQMNARAQALGLQDSHFTNPHGYHDPDHRSSARDMAALAMYAMGQPRFAQMMNHSAWTMQKTAKREAMHIEVNTDLFRPASRFYYPGAFGIKSGYTRAAGFCYVGCATRDGKTLLAVVLNCRTRDQAWTDMGRLFNLGFAAK